MLRAKQLGSLPHYARQLYLNGTRSGCAESAKGTCSDDEACVPKIEQDRAIKATAVGVAPTKSGPPYSQNAVGPISQQKSSYIVSAKHVISSSSSLRSDSSPPKAGPDSLNASAKIDVVDTSKITTGHFVKTGIRTVGILSDKTRETKSNLQNSVLDIKASHEIITSNGKLHDISVAGINTSHKAIVSNGKLHEFNVAKTKSSYETMPSNYKLADTSDCSKRIDALNFYSSCSINTVDKPASSANASVKQNGIGLIGSSVGTNGVSSDAKCQRQSSRQKVKFHSNDLSSELKPGGTSEKKMTGSSMETAGSTNRFQNPVRYAKAHVGSYPSANRKAKSGYVIDLYRQTLQQLKWGSTAKEALNNLQHKINPYQANQVLKSLNDHFMALEFFKWLRSQPGFRHDGHTYTTMIGILGHARQFAAMRRVIEEMAADGCQPTKVTYNRLIHVYGRANYLDEVVKVFLEMQKFGHRPDQVTYCTLIDIYAKAGHLEVALDLYQKMQEEGISLDTYTCTTMVNCFAKSDHLSDAFNMFHEMNGRGCEPSLVTYNIMIHLHAKRKNYPKVVKLYKEMQVAGFRPDMITYSIVMEALGHDGYLEEAEAVFKEMARDWVPDEPVYGLLVDLWGKAGNVEKARAWYQAMLDAGLQPNVPTCNSLISAFLKVHSFTDAYDFLVNMLGLGLVPSLQTYTLLLSCCTATHEMGPCCELMAITGHPAHSFLLSLPDPEPNGENVKAHARGFFNLVHSEDRESKRGLVDAIVDFLRKSGLKEEAGLIWEVAAERNVYPDLVRETQRSNWNINLHVMSEGTAITALSRTLAWFRRQMLASGVCPQRLEIITGWGRRSRVTGSSLVKHSVQELLNAFNFPFFTEDRNSGCFIGQGEFLNRWLLNSYVERMHLW
ncbi:pentatricopeptide repeat-containing protein At1g74750-like isoform X2 [Zingiber officinale]|uniref:pentatricopeptide repeat-containing protein At1g74750-like isoform X2 n=1 Tax=Zingiber officinale TaxID=94328 RepID=UPI001C4DCC2D|nr:pentatricopeptide repeat-containing protein At1g74750-like isoform X2 [Zingiber officinale]